MKIAIVNPWSISYKSIGGTERFVIDLAESLTNLGNEVDVYMFSGENHVEKGVNYININLFNMEGDADEYIIQNAFGEFETEESYINLAEKLEKIDMTKYDCLHLNSLLFLHAWKEKRRVFTIHTNPFEYELAWGKNSYYKMLEIMATYKNDELTTFVAPSEFYAKQYEDLTGCKVKFIPHSIDSNRLFTDLGREKIEEKYNLSQKKTRIIVPSRLEPIQKQPMLLIDALSLLESDIKEKLEIIFTGLDKQYIKFVDELKEKSEKNNLDIKILRFDEMAEVYKIADFTVLPSRSESFGYSALESLSLGIPTILNDIPTFKEIGENSINCVFFDNTFLDLKEKIERMIKKTMKRVVQSENWNKQYSPKTFANNYMKLMV